MPDVTFLFSERVTRVDVGASLLAASRLGICLLQLPSSAVAVDGDHPRPLAIGTVRDLLVGGPDHAMPALQRMISGADPVLVVAPEFTFGSGDWAEIDALVRAATRPIILLAGFGATIGQSVLDWQAAGAGEATQRHLGWREAEGAISDIQRLNGGWCWLHAPGEATHCIVYLKNVLEQSVEAVNLPDLQEGRAILHLAFGDVDIFPLICADLLQPAAQNAGSPQARIVHALEATAVDRPALVVGSLLQSGYNVNWVAAVNSLLNTVLAGRPGAVALCNIAADAPKADEAHDKWRSLSGLYVPFDALPKGQDDLPAVRALNDMGIAGGVVRATEACATTGHVTWGPFTPVKGKFAWRGNMSCPISDAGLATLNGPTPPPAAGEIARFLRRYPPVATSAPRLQLGLNLVVEQLHATAAPTPEALLDATLSGVAPSRSQDPDRLHVAETSVAFKAGIHAVATLKSIDGISWQANPKLTGQLRLANAKHLLVWRSPDKSRLAMRRDLAAWRMLPGGEHPDLIVLGAGPNGDLVAGEIPQDRRDDISTAPSSGAELAAGGSLAARADDFTAARNLRRVASLGLANVADVYADFEEGADAGRVAALLGQIDACFAEDGAE
ncbi:ABC-three component system protein [Pacificimonas sp. ICDLI1SI03]